MGSVAIVSFRGSGIVPPAKPMHFDGTPMEGDTIHLDGNVWKIREGGKQWTEAHSDRVPNNLALVVVVDLVEE